MPSVLDRSALEQSPLADLHLLANELGVDGFRRLRKPDLVDAILSRQSGEEVVEPEAEPSAEVEAVAAAAVGPTTTQPKRSRRGRRGGRGRRRDEEEGDDGAIVDRDEPRGRRRAPERAATSASVEGAVELLANGSGFLRLAAGRRPTTTSTSPPRRSSAASSSPATASPARCAPRAAPSASRR